MLQFPYSPIGVHIAEMGFEDSDVQRIMKAISWLHDNFSSKGKLQTWTSWYYEWDLVSQALAFTSMSLLQYQKALCLREARSLMLSSLMDATTACQLVGDVINSQFSRDYSRFF